MFKKIPMPSPPIPAWNLRGPGCGDTEGPYELWIPDFAGMTPECIFTCLDTLQVQSNTNKCPTSFRHTGVSRYPGKYSGFRLKACRNDDGLVPFILWTCTQPDKPPWTFTHNVKMKSGGYHFSEKTDVMNGVKSPCPASFSPGQRPGGRPLRPRQVPSPPRSILRRAPCRGI
jgi:hypothetical protein